MTVRHLFHSPLRSITAIFGSAVSVALLVTALFTYDSIDSMIESLFFKIYRYDAALYFDHDIDSSVLFTAEKWPGVLKAEPFRNIRAEYTKGHKTYRSFLVGLTQNAEFMRPLDKHGFANDLKDETVSLNSYLAAKLGVTSGDVITINLPDQNNKKIELPISSLVEENVGLIGYVSLKTLNRILEKPENISGIYLDLDPLKEREIYKKIKDTPHVSAIALMSISLREFRHTMDQNIFITTAIYTALAVIITFGVVYNTARIQLSERSKELAGMRIFGFQTSEVFQLFIGEIVVFLLLAQPLGWTLGFGFAWLVTVGFSSDQFRIPFVIYPSTFALASLISVSAATFSLLTVYQKVSQLDLVKVLKARE